MDWGRPEYLSQLFQSSFELIFEEGINKAHFDSAEQMYEFYARSFGPLRELLGLIGEDDQHAVRDEFIEVHNQYVVPAGIAISRPYLIVVGKRSSS